MFYLQPSAELLMCSLACGLQSKVTSWIVERRRGRDVEFGAKSFSLLEIYEALVTNGL